MQNSSKSTCLYFVKKTAAWRSRIKVFRLLSETWRRGTIRRPKIEQMYVTQENKGIRKEPTLGKPVRGD